MDPFEGFEISCPYCGEVLTITIDPTVPQQEYVEDCHVCCRPILFRIDAQNPEAPIIDAQPENL